MSTDDGARDRQSKAYTTRLITPGFIKSYKGFEKPFGLFYRYARTVILNVNDSMICKTLKRNVRITAISQRIVYQLTQCPCQRNGSMETLGR